MTICEYFSAPDTAARRCVLIYSELHNLCQGSQIKSTILIIQLNPPGTSMLSASMVVAGIYPPERDHGKHVSSTHCCVLDSIMWYLLECLSIQTSTPHLRCFKVAAIMYLMAAQAALNWTTPSFFRWLGYVCFMFKRERWNWNKRSGDVLLVLDWFIVQVCSCNSYWISCGGQTTFNRNQTH